ncbi:hypothetical protein V3C99_011500, partial [Haemonchus contortus]|uniref:Uncharacterized protein n=1 Tax=Haemonchus contortus TaxID=6289 RepID=A0A7I4Y787_HAECO
TVIQQIHHQYIMFFYYLIFFCLLYDVLDEDCDAHIILGHSTKWNPISKGLGDEKLSGDWPEYIDEVVERATDSLPLFESLRLGEISRSKPRLFQRSKMFREVGF